MGVDYYECNKCGFGFRDDSEYCVYCDCGAHFCSKDCANPTYETRIEKLKEFGSERDYEYEACISCCVCNNEHCTDYALLQFLLGHFNISIDEAKELYFKANPKKE